MRSGWRVDCLTDKFTDDRSCYAAKHFSNPTGTYAMVRVELNRFGTWVSFGAHNYPGLNGRVRIDGNRAVSFGEAVITGPTAQGLVQRMLAGRSGFVEYYSWPDGVPREFSFDLVGFPEAYRLLRGKFDTGR